MVDIGRVASPASRRGGTRILFAWPVVTVGAFDCWPDDIRWRSENCADEGHLIAFPGTSVEITQDGHPPAVTDATQIVLYNRNQTYRRRLVSRSGDHCTYLVVSPELLAEIATDEASSIRDPGRQPFAEPVMPIGRQEHLAQRVVLELLDSGRGNDPLELQERLVSLVWRALAYAGAVQTMRRGRRAATEREHRRIVEDARALLSAELGQPLSLEDLAREIGTSVFHLSRVFRERVGMSLHAYRDELRLRSAVSQVLEGSRRLTDVALDHGYASSSHFADRFGSRYGTSPSALRDQMRRRSA